MTQAPNLVAYCKRMGNRTAIVLNFEPENIPTAARHRIANPRCKTVCVVAVDEHEAQRYQPPFGKAKPAAVGQIFPSAASASEHLGYNCNAVALRMAKDRARARREGTPADSEIVLRGVTLAYTETKEAQP